jgi:ribokinase
MRFVAYGELMLDVEIAAGAEPHGASIRVRAGGTAANAALAAAAAGASSVCVGRVGADAAAAAVEWALRAGGVEPQLAVDSELPTGTFATLGAKRAVDRGANRALTACAVECDALLVSGYALLPETAAAATATLRDARAAVRGLTGGSPALLREHRAAFLAAARHASLVVVDEAEAAELGPVADAAVCVTRGAAGATLRLDGTEVDAPGSGVHGDAVGAGDALAATLVVELARGTAPAVALARACAAGARAALA